MIQVTTEEMYATACQALGEAQVRERLITAEVQRLAAENADLRQQLATTQPAPA